jgi:uncharacterized membrane protein
MSLGLGLRFFHILAAMIWLGGAIYLEGLMASARRSGDAEAPLRTYLRAADTNRVLIKYAGLATLLSGVLMVLESTAWTFGAGWVWIALVLTAVAVYLANFYFGPQSGKIARSVGGEGYESQNALATLAGVRRAAHIQGVLLLVTLALMVFKPWM